MTPMDLAWWTNLEKEYGRDLVKENRLKTNNTSEVSFIGFFGENAKFSYENLRNIRAGQMPNDISFGDETEILACNCTD